MTDSFIFLIHSCCFDENITDLQSFSHISGAACQQDAAFNKTTRSLQELQQKDLGVKPEFRSVQLFFSSIIQKKKKSTSYNCHCRILIWLYYYTTAFLSQCVSWLLTYSHLFSVLLLCFRSINLSRAKRELSQLNQQTSPLLKLLCLRRVALTATQTPRRTGTCCLCVWMWMWIQLPVS